MTTPAFQKKEIFFLFPTGFSGGKKNAAEVCKTSAAIFRLKGFRLPVLFGKDHQRPEMRLAVAMGPGIRCQTQTFVSMVPSSMRSWR